MDIIGEHDVTEFQGAREGVGVVLGRYAEKPTGTCGRTDTVLTYLHCARRKFRRKNAVVMGTPPLQGRG